MAFSAIKLRNVLDCSSENIGSNNGWKTFGFLEIIFIIFRLFHCYPVVLLGVISLALLRVSKRLTVGRSAEGEIRARLSISLPGSEAAGVSSLGWCSFGSQQVENGHGSRNAL